MEIETRLPIGHELYNDEPVFYCNDCLSLAIKSSRIGDMCCNCGSMRIIEGSLKEYDERYAAKYGSKLFYK